MEREKPILFNTAMVQAVLDGRKTATRRIAKGICPYGEYGDFTAVIRGEWTGPVSMENLIKLKSRYQTGDILYARETWAFVSCIKCSGAYLPKGEPLNCYDTKAVEYDDGSSISDGCFLYRADYSGTEPVIWRPSIHMPKEAARIWLRVKDVRVERLQDMTLDDFLAEGVTLRPEAFNDPENAYLQARTLFKGIWDSTVPKAKLAEYGWDADPWVWAVKFCRCEKPAAE